MDWGDCRQELVFIGAEMDQKTIVELLENCLLTTSEFEEFKEKNFSDEGPKERIQHWKTLWGTRRQCPGFG